MTAMLWSRATVIDSAANLADSHAVEKGAYLTLQKWRNLTYEEARLIYPVHDTVVYIRPTLRKSRVLYCVFAIQPLLIIVILGLTLVFHSTSLDNGSSLTSIMSGIGRGSLDLLAGATLSGELSRSVKLVMHPIQDNYEGVIKYHATPSTAPMQNGRLSSKSSTTSLVIAL